MMVEWDVQKGGAQCGSCRGAFLDNQPYHCLLRLDAETPQRSDYCAACWARETQTALAGLKEYASWTARYKVILPVPKEEPVKRDHAETVFRKLLSSQDPSMKKIIFVLAVMLERKRILKQQKVLREGKKLLVYAHAQTGESIVIEDPQISLSQWGQVQREVKQILEDELTLLGK